MSDLRTTCCTVCTRVLESADRIARRGWIMCSSTSTRLKSYSCQGNVEDGPHDVRCYGTDHDLVNSDSLLWPLHSLSSALRCEWLSHANPREFKPKHQACITCHLADGIYSSSLHTGIDGFAKVSIFAFRNGCDTFAVAETGTTPPISSKALPWQRLIKP